MKQNSREKQKVGTLELTYILDKSCHEVASLANMNYHYDLPCMIYYDVPLLRNFYVWAALTSYKNLYTSDLFRLRKGKKKASCLK